MIKICLFQCVIATKLFKQDVLSFAAGFLELEGENKLNEIDVSWSGVGIYKSAFTAPAVLQHQQTGELLWDKLVWTDKGTEKYDFKGNRLQRILQNKEPTFEMDRYDSGPGPREIDASKWTAVFMWFYLERFVQKVNPEHPFVKALVLAVAERIEDVNFDCEEMGSTFGGRIAARVTPLILAATLGCQEAVKVLIERGAMVDFPDEEGYTPFHLAAIYGHSGCCKRLFRANADFNLRGGPNGHSPIMSACVRGHTNVVESLLEMNALPDRLVWKIAREKGIVSDRCPRMKENFERVWKDARDWEIEEERFDFEEKIKKKQSQYCLIV